MNTIIKVLQLIPIEKLRTKVIHALLDYVNEEPILTKNGFLVLYNSHGLIKTVRKQVITGLYEKEEIFIYKKIIKAGDIVIDVGANEGYMSLIFSKLVGERGLVFSIEPDKYNVERLKKNMALNKYSNVNVFECAVGKEKSVVQFYYTLDPDSGGGGAWGSLLKNPMSNADASVEVQVETLDSLLSNVENVSFIKIDTEGSEYDVFKGAEGIIDKAKPVISFEVNLSKWADMETSVSHMFNYLESKGYNLYLPMNGRLTKLEWLNSRIMNVFAIHKTNEGYFEGTGILTIDKNRSLS